MGEMTHMSLFVLVVEPVSSPPVTPFSYLFMGHWEEHPLGGMENTTAAPRKGTLDCQDTHFRSIR